MRAWLHLLDDKASREKILTGLFGVFLCIVVVAVACCYFFGGSALYATLVDRDWGKWQEDAWIILLGTLILAFAAHQDHAGKGWNGDLWWICAMAYFFLPIICTGIANEPTVMGARAYALWLYTYRHYSGFAGVIAVFAAYYLSLGIGKKLVTYRKPRAPLLPRRPNPVPTMPPRAASILPFGRKK